MGGCEIAASVDGLRKRFGDGIGDRRFRGGHDGLNGTGGEWASGGKQEGRKDCCFNNQRKFQNSLASFPGCARSGIYLGHP